MMKMNPSSSNINKAINAKKPMMNATNFGVEMLFPSVKYNLTSLADGRVCIFSGGYTDSNQGIEFYCPSVGVGEVPLTGPSMGQGAMGGILR